MTRLPDSCTSQTRYDFALASLEQTELPSDRVYDVGPGDGRMKSRVNETGYQWYGFDINAWDGVSKWDLNEPCPVQGEEAGLILLLDVIEHCMNPGLALSNISEILPPDGRLVLTAPNPRWSGARINHLFRGVLSGFSEQDLEENHHVFTPWIHVLEKMLNDANLQIENYVMLDGRTRLLSSSGSLMFPMRIVLNAVQMLIEVSDPSSRGMSFGIVARKMPDK